MKYQSTALEKRKLTAEKKPSIFYSQSNGLHLT